MEQIICHNIVSVDKEGIVLECQNANISIRFDECAKNFAFENSLNESNCIATRDITSLSFVFFMQPKIRIVFKKKLLKELFTGKSAVGKFIELQHAISKAGYTSYDLS